MNAEYYQQLLHSSEEGQYDITPIFKQPEAFQKLIDDLSAPFIDEPFDTVAGIESMGFIIGSAMSFKLNKKFVPVRRGHKLPGVKTAVVNTSFADHSGLTKIFEIYKIAIQPGEKVLLVDDRICSGTQAKAAVNLIEKRGGIVVGLSVLFADRNRESENLFQRYRCHAIKTVENPDSTRRVSSDGERHEQ